MAKYSDSLQVVGTALVKSKDALLLLGMLLVIFVLLFASAIFLAENVCNDAWRVVHLVREGGGDPAPGSEA